MPSFWARSPREHGSKEREFAMEQKISLHELALVRARKPAQAQSFTLAVQDRVGGVTVYSVDPEKPAAVLDHVVATTATVHVFQNRLFALDGDGQVRCGLLSDPELAARPVSFTGIQALSANREQLLLLTQDNELLLLDSQLQIRRQGRFAHRVKDIHIGEEGTVWIAGGEEVLGGYQVFWSTVLESFRQIPWPASAVGLYGDRSGIVWTVNSNTEIWKLHRLGEGNMPGCRQDPTCRNCMFKSYNGALRVAAPQGLFLVLRPDGVLQGHPFPGAVEASLQWQNVARFTVC
jgi:hypothetical protein